MAFNQWRIKGGIEEKEEYKETFIELLDLVNRHEERTQLNVEIPVDVDLGTNESHEWSSELDLMGEMRNKMIALFIEYKNVFVWSYEDMPGLNTKVVVHRLPVKPECKPIKQNLRRIRPERTMKFKEELIKQLDRFPRG